MKEKLFILICACGLLLGGCTDEEKEEIGKISSKQETVEDAGDETSNLNIQALYSTDHRISVETAEEDLMNLYGAFAQNEDNGMRSGKVPSIASVEVMRKGGCGLRSGDANDILPDTLVYLMNFADSSGFAILRADDRIPERVIAYSENGNLDLNGDDEVSQTIVEMVRNYAESSITEFEEERDSLWRIAEGLEWRVVEGDTNICDNGLRSNVSNIATENGMRVQPVGDFRIRPFVKSNWGQGKPYNYYVCYKNCPSGTAPAGCVAIAIGQLMAYYKIPNSISGSAIDWNAINSKPLYRPQETNNPNALKAAKLLELIGNGVKMKYDCNKGSSSIEKSMLFLMLNGYDCIYIGSFIASLAEAAIIQQMPIIMCGTDTRVKKGHEWLLDGFLKQNQYVTFYKKIYNKQTGGILYATETTIPVTFRYYHVNWGWHGNDDGYFAENAMNPTDREYNAKQKILIVNKR